MAEKQLENGFTPIPNEVLEHLMKMHLSANQWQVLLCIIRKTDGFQKKVDWIANFQIGQATGLGKTVVSRALHYLEDMKLITRKGKVIGIQRDWTRWKGLAFQPPLGTELAELPTSDLSEKLAKQLTKVSNPEERLAKQSTKVSSPDVTQKKKETITKETIQKKGAKKHKYFFDNILLTEEEYNKLVERFGEAGTRDRLETLSYYKKSKGKRYASDYATILAWDKRDQKGGNDGANRGHSGARKLPKVYRSPEEIFGAKNG